MIAKFRCLRCGYEYEDNPKPTTCKICGNLYVKWLNYEDLYNKYFYNQIERFYSSKNEK